MKAKELREKKDEELVAELEKITKEYKDSKFKKVTGVLENPLKIRSLRKTIARVNTILHMRKIDKIKKELVNME